MPNAGVGIAVRLGAGKDGSSPAVRWPGRADQAGLVRPERAILEGKGAAAHSHGGKSVSSDPPGASRNPIERCTRGRYQCRLVSSPAPSRLSSGSTVRPRTVVHHLALGWQIASVRVSESGVRGLTPEAPDPLEKSRPAPSSHWGAGSPRNLALRPVHGFDRAERVAQRSALDLQSGRDGAGLAQRLDRLQHLAVGELQALDLAGFFVDLR